MEADDDQLQTYWNRYRENADSIADVRAMLTHAQQRTKALAKARKSLLERNGADGKDGLAEVFMDEKGWRRKAVVLNGMMEIAMEDGWADVPEWDDLGNPPSGLGSNGTPTRIAECIVQVCSNEDGLPGSKTALLDEVDEIRPNTTGGSGATRRYLSQNPERFEHLPPESNDVDTLYDWAEQEIQPKNPPGENPTESRGDL